MKSQINKPIIAAYLSSGTAIEESSASLPADDQLCWSFEEIKFMQKSSKKKNFPFKLFFNKQNYLT